MANPALPFTFSIPNSNFPFFLSTHNKNEMTFAMLQKIRTNVKLYVLAFPQREALGWEGTCSIENSFDSRHKSLLNK